MRPGCARESVRPGLTAALLGRQPTLSGEAYELSTRSSSSPGGRRPLANVIVLLDAFFGNDHVIARTLTDAEGRYVFCNVPFLPGLTVTAGLDGFEKFVSTADLTGRSTVDLEMRRK